MSAARASAPPPRPEAWSDSALILLALLALASVAWTLEGERKSDAYDFYQFWLAGRVLAESQRPVDLYSDSAQVRLAAEFRDRAHGPDGARYRAAAEYFSPLALTGSPLLYTIVSRISTGRFETDLAVWAGLGTLALVSAIALTCRLLGYSAAATLAAIALFAAWYRPLRIEIVLLNTNQLQLGMLALLLAGLSRPATRTRNAACGFLIAFAVLFKPNLALVPVILALVWLVDGAHRTLVEQGLGAALAVTGIAALTAAEFGGLACWPAWVARVNALVTGPPWIGNVSPVDSAVRRLGLPVDALALGALLAVSAVCVWRTRGPRPQGSVPGRLTGADGTLDRGALAVGLGITLPLLASRLVWPHYWVFAIPAALMLLRPGAAARHRWRAGLAVAALASLLAVPPLEAGRGSRPEVWLSAAAGLAFSLLLLFELGPPDARRVSAAARSGAYAPPQPSRRGTPK